MESSGRMIIVPDNPEAFGEDEVLKAIVVKVFDGDGFLTDVWNPLRHDWVKRVPFRMAFIDAPEMEQPFGPEAGRFLGELIHRKTLRLDPVVKESTPCSPVDQYKRMLCMVFLTEPMPTGRIEYYFNAKLGSGLVKESRLIIRNIELEMVVNGWAWVTEQYDFDRQEEYFDAQNDARQHRRGLWQMDKPEPPWTFKRRQKARRRASEGQGRLI